MPKPFGHTHHITTPLGLRDRFELSSAAYKAAVLAVKRAQHNLGPRAGVEPASSPYQGLILTVELPRNSLGLEERLELSLAHYGCAFLAIERLQHKTWMTEWESNPPLAVLQTAPWPIGFPPSWCGERDSNPCHRVGNAIS